MKKRISSAIILLALACVVWKIFWSTEPVRLSEESVALETNNGLIFNKKNHTENIKESSNQLISEYTDYQSQLDRDFKSLPIVDDIRKLTPNEVHHTPEILKNGGELVGRIHDEAESDPAKRVEAMSFFKKCAEDKQIATAIRAVCLSKVYKLVPLWKIPSPLSEEDISKEISDLALKLP